jgi:NAD(P)-dependent dehydrogenase (short-subunit alcohol dehydrogenase family)
VSSEKKVVVITGASQGIGAVLVRATRYRNYRVVGIFAATATILVSSGHAQTIQSVQRSVSGVSIAASSPVSPQSDAAARSAGARRGSERRQR